MGGKPEGRRGRDGVRQPVGQTAARPDGKPVGPGALIDGGGWDNVGKCGKGRQRGVRGQRQGSE